MADLSHTDRTESIPADVLDQVERALTDAVSTSITLGPKLSEPYPDDTRWTPNTRFLEPMGRRAHAGSPSTLTVRLRTTSGVLITASCSRRL